jgi:hypothetical protein
MRKLIILTLVSCLTMALHAQRKSDVPAFGKVEKADLELKECDFDKKADAMVLFDAGELSCNITSYDIIMDLEKHIRIKILSDKGLDRANIHLRYLSYRNKQQVKNLSAQTYNLDANGNIVVTKVEKKLIYNKPIDKRYSEEIFTFPEVKAGSIIEFKYTKTNVGMADWYFQKSMPVKYSRYRVDFPNEIEVYAQPFCNLEYSYKKDARGTRTVQLYSMSNIPGLRDEPYISCEEDYLQRVELRPLALNLPTQRVPLVSNWPKVIKELMEDEDFGVQLKRNIPRTADLDEQLKTITDPYRKMAIIHEYVRKNMEWNGYSNIWALDGVRSAWKEKKGTSGEINLALVNLLKDAGLKAHALLVSTREHGLISVANADYSQFDKVLAFVEIGDKKYVLDATDKYTPSHLIPMDVMFSEGLVIEKPETFEWGWKQLWDDKHMMKNVVVMHATIDSAGVMKGEATVHSYDYTRVQRLPDARKEKNKLLEKYFTASNPGAKIDSLEIGNLDNDSLPLVQKVQFSMPVNASGEYQFFNVNMFTGLEKNPFVADSRFSDIFFGANQSYSVVANIKIPAGYTFETLPKNIRMIMPDTSISMVRRLAAENNELSVRMTLDIKKPFFAVQEYPDFKEFYKQLFNLLSEQIALKKMNN